MLTAKEIVLEYVCPLFGCLAANFMFTAPLKDVRRAVERGTLGSLNPTPWAVMTGNCTGWVTYSYLIHNQFLFWANAPGLILSVWLNMAATKLQYCDRMSASMRLSFVQLLDANRNSFAISDSDRRLPGGDTDEEKKERDEEEDEVDEKEGEKDDTEEGMDEEACVNGKRTTIQNFAAIRTSALEITTQKIEAPASHEKVVVGVVTVWIAVISVLSFLKVSAEQWQTVVGVVVNINLCFFYGAPLSTIFTVLKTRDSSSIHRWTMLMNTANACFWTAFGFGVLDWFIIVPNGLGAILGFIQMFLRLVVPSRDIFPSSDETERRSGDNAAPKVKNTKAENEEPDPRLGLDG